MHKIYAGLASIVVAVITTVVASLLMTAIAGPAAVIGVGMFATGFIAIVVGLVGLLTGRDLGEVFGRQSEDD